MMTHGELFAAHKDIKPDVDFNPLADGYEDEQHAYVLRIRELDQYLRELQVVSLEAECVLSSKFRDLHIPLWKMRGKFVAKLRQKYRPLPGGGYDVDRAEAIDKIIYNMSEYVDGKLQLDEFQSEVEYIINNILQLSKPYLAWKLK